MNLSKNEKVRNAVESKMYQNEIAEANAKKFESIIVHMTAKGGTSGRIFGSVTSKEIAAQLKKEHGIDIQKQKLVLKESIKNFGRYNIKVKLYPGVVGNLTVVVDVAE